MATFLEAVIAYCAPYGYIFAITTFVSAIVIMFLVMERSSLKSYAEDILVRKTCKSKNKPLGRIVDKAGTEIEFVVETSPEMPGTVDYKNTTLVAPNLISTNQRGRLKNGVPTLNYVLPYHFPTGFASALAICQMVKFLRSDDYKKEFGWISDDFALIHLMFCTDKYLVVNCIDVISTYIDMGMDIPDEYLAIPSEDEYEDMEYPEDIEDENSLINIEDDIEGDYNE